MDMPALYFLLLLVTDSLSCIHFLYSTMDQDVCWQPPFCKCSNLWSLIGLQVCVSSLHVLTTYLAKLAPSAIRSTHWYMTIGCVCVSVCNTQVPMGHLGGFMGEATQEIVGGPSNVAHKVIRRTHILFILSEPWLLFFQLLTTLQLCSYDSILGCSKKEMDLLAVPHITRKAHIYSRPLTFCHGENNHWLIKDLLALICAALGKGWHR